MAVTWNPSDKAADLTLSNGNLTVTKNTDGVAYANVRATVAKTTGKWYWEIHLDGYADAGVDGIATVDLGLTSFPSSNASAWANNGSNHAGIVNNSIGFTFAHPASGDTMAFAYDADAATLKIYKNNTLMGTLTSVVGTYPMTALFYSADVQTTNFGATAFTYTPPSGYSGLDSPPISISVSDQLNISENVTITQISNIFVSDQLNITESVTMLDIQNINVFDQLNITESITMLDIQNISVSDQLNITESISREANNFISVNDQLNITESLTIFINPLLISVSDQLNITESVTTALFQETLTLSVSDQLNITESVQTGLDNYISVNDQLTITESVSTSVQSYISVSDQLNITEAVTPGLVSFINVSDQLNVTESVTKTVSEVARGLVYMRGGDQNLPVTLTKQDYPLAFNDTSVS